MHSPVRRGSPACAAALAAVMALDGAACASTPVHRLAVVPAPQGVATRLSDLAVPAGATCLVTLESGEIVYGRVVVVTPNELVLDQIEDTSTPRRTIADAELARVARVTGRSKLARGAIGGAIGAIASLPLSMSMVGDAMLIGTLLGNLCGRRTGDSRLEVVFQRPGR